MSANVSKSLSAESNTDEKLTNAISKIVFEMRELESLIISVRQDIRNLSDENVKSIRQNAELGAEVGISNKRSLDLDKVLNELLVKENTLCIHLNELIKMSNDIDDKDKEWNREQIAMYQKNQADSLKVFQKAQSDALKEYQAATRAMIWKMLGIILAFAVAMAGLNGVIHV